jgi:succinate-acetate transporter protein
VVFLIMWSVITFIFTLATLGTNWTVFWTFIVFDCALVIETIGFWRGSAQIQHIGGYFEMVLAAMAWYIVMAEVVNESVDHPVFPLFPFKKPWFKPVSPPVHYPEHIGGTAGA